MNRSRKKTPLPKTLFQDEEFIRAVRILLDSRSKDKAKRCRARKEAVAMYRGRMHPHIGVSALQSASNLAASAFMKSLSLADRFHIAKAGIRIPGKYGHFGLRELNACRDILRTGFICEDHGKVAAACARSPSKRRRAGALRNG